MTEANDATSHASQTRARKRTRHIPRVLWRVLLVVLYVAAWVALDRTTGAFETLPGVSPWYPPPALSLALVLLGGPRYAPVLLLGPLLKGFWLERLPITLLDEFVLALIRAAVYASAGAALHYVARIDRQLRRLRDVAWFVGMALTAPLLVALLTAADFAHLRVVGWPDYGSAVLDFWVGSAVGIICFTPALLIYGARWAESFAGWPWRRAAIGWRWPGRLAALEGLGQAASILVILVFAFRPEPTLGLSAFCLCFLPLIWIATRNGLPRTAAAIVLINSGAALLFGIQDSLDIKLTSLQFFLLALSLVGLVLGVIISERKRAAEAQRFLAEARTHLAADNAQLYREAQRHLAELNTVQRVAQAINSTLRLDRIFQTVVNQIGTAFGYHLVGIYLCQDGGLVLQAAIGYDDVIPFLRLDQGVCGRVARTGEAAFVRDGRHDPDFIVVAPETRQAIIVPLKSGDRQVLGTLLVESTGDPALTDDDCTLLLLLAEQVSIAVANARLFADLRASEQRYRTLVAQAADSILVTTTQGRLIDVNEQATTLLGYTQEELLRMFVRDLIAPEDKVQALKAFEVLQRNGRVFTTLRLRRRDGSLFPVEISAGGIAEGTILAIVRDVSERQLLEAQLRQAQKIEAIGTLANGIAHDFNNLLAAIMGYASLILDDMSIADPKHEELDQIVRAAQRGAGLTGQLLAFSRPSATERRPSDLSALVQEALRLLRPTIPSTITIIPELEPQLWKAEVDSAQFQQVVVNLAVNARDALPEGGLIRITTANAVLDPLFCERHLGALPGRYVQMSVADNGIGMDMMVLNHIFEPFFTTKEPGKGTGLGLAITHGIVRSHGGAIDVVSQLGEGTTIAIYLPAIVEEASASEEQATFAPRGHGELILVVDDEPEVRELGQRILARYGYQTLSAENGRKAVALYRQQHADIAAVLLDLTMPELDGRATFHALRAIDQTLQVVFCSGQNPGEFGVQATMPGTAFVAKPYSIPELTRAIAQVLQAGKRTYAP